MRLDFGLYLFLLKPLLLQLFLLMLGKESLRVMSMTENVIGRGELDVRHLDHNLQMLLVKDLLHIGNLCFANLPLLLVILDKLLGNEATDFSVVELGHIALIIEVFHAANHVKRGFV